MLAQVTPVRSDVTLLTELLKAIWTNEKSRSKWQGPLFYPLCLISLNFGLAQTRGVIAVTLTSVGISFTSSLQ